MARSFLYILLISLIACADQSSSERVNGYSDIPGNAADSLFKDVMDGHDVAMAKMGKLAGYRKTVEQKLDSLSKLPAAAQAGISNALKDLKGELQKAEDGMNNWMQEFSLDSAEGELEQRLKYLESEKIRVNKVKDDIFGALERADSLLQKALN